jgi:putative tricarboxylic transport membrane protein
MSIMGVLGYLLRKFDFETAPIVLGVVLAPIFEMSLRQSLAMSNGKYSIFFQRPISVAFLIGAFIMVVIALIPLIRKGIDYGWRDQLTKVEKEK